MQRLAAITLLAFFACLTGAPFAVAFQSADSLLPACCRSAGAHHCAMKDAPAHARSASITGVRCRAYPQHAPALLRPLAAITAPQALSLTLDSGSFQTIAALQSYAQARRTRSPRGPPSGTRPS